MFIYSLHILIHMHTYIYVYKYTYIYIYLSNNDAPTIVPIVKKAKIEHNSTVLAFIANVLACNDSTKSVTPVLFLPMYHIYIHIYIYVFTYMYL
jgi:hypothetical protein